MLFENISKRLGLIETVGQCSSKNVHVKILLRNDDLISR